MRQQVPQAEWQLPDEAYLETLYRWSFSSVRDAAGVLGRRFPESKE